MDEFVPKGEPGSCDAFLIIRPFMWRDLGLKGTQLLVFARIYGFCKGGGCFYESRAKTAEYLCVSERSVIRAIGDLSERDLIEEIDAPWHPDGFSTRSYRLGYRALMPEASFASDKKSPPDTQGHSATQKGDSLSSDGVKDWHLIKKADNKDF